jgi:preprotein translocase subunit SecD
MTAPLRSAYLFTAWLALVLLLIGCVQAPDLTLTFRLDTGGSTPVGDALLEARDTLRRRLDRLGVSPAVVETAGTDRILVRISRADDSEQVRRILSRPAVFELRLIRLPKNGPPLSSRDEVLAHFGGQLPPDLEILEEDVRDKDGTVTGTRYNAVERQAVLTGRDIKSARRGLGQFGEPIVEFTVKPEPAKAFAQATGDNVGSLLAIVIDGRVVSAPMINARIGESGIIEGGYTKEQAQDLAILLGSGLLPGSLTLVEERVEGGGR